MTKASTGFGAFMLWDCDKDWDGTSMVFKRHPQFSTLNLKFNHINIKLF
jgi:hypothetical protein